MENDKSLVSLDMIAIVIEHFDYSSSRKAKEMTISRCNSLVLIIDIYEPTSH